MDGRELDPARLVFLVRLDHNSLPGSGSHLSSAVATARWNITSGSYFAGQYIMNQEKRPAKVTSHLVRLHDRHKMTRGNWSMSRIVPVRSDSMSLSSVEIETFVHQALPLFHFLSLQSMND